MIGSLSGKLAEVDVDGDSGVQLVVDVGGVGYRVVVSPRHGASLSPLGSSIAMSIHTHVREGAITLYGFIDSAERRAFELLLGAHGVGPALALSVLSSFSPAALANAIVDGDVDGLTEVPGVGRKTAQRLIVDLAQRFEGDLARSHGEESERDETRDVTRSEARAALVALGYGPAEIRHALERVVDAEPTVEAVVRAALRELAPSR